ncbi:MAG: hypothetical protein JWO48_2665 [Bryobacterales bacterium]|nr:hypothetical protein [Bryobacterales bacterium]
MAHSRKLRGVLSGAAALWLVSCAACSALWIRGYHHETRVRFQTRYGLSEVASRDGKFWFSNEPQRELEFAAIDQRLGTRAHEHFALEQEAYTRSGRDLADDRTAEQRLARESFEEHHQITVELQQEIVREKEMLRQRWAQTPPIRRSIPCMIPTLITGLGPGIFLVPLLLSVAVRRRANLRRKSHLCAKCGYDLRATPDRCPECGALNS